MKRPILNENVKIYDLERKEFFYEKVFGEWFLKWIYHTRSGSMLSFLFTKLPFSSIYGGMKNLGFTKKDIIPFIEDYAINIDEFEDISHFKNFNDFFIRKFKENQRSFEQDSNIFPAFCEGRYLVYNSPKETLVKNSWIDPRLFLEKEDQNIFKNGQVIISRLAPVDYHRFHFPDDGEVLKNYKVDGLLNSVTPYALSAKPDVLMTNKREITILDTSNFGKIAYVEVGALSVGTIKQTYSNDTFKKGEEKGYFLFGGSTVVIITENKIIDFNEDILQKTKEGIETFVKLGCSLGVRTT